MPSSIAILILLTIALAILTHLIPAGEYTRVDNVPIAGTYTVTEPNPQGIWDILAAPMEGFRGAIDIILFVFVLSGCLGILGKSRSLDAGLMYVINRLNGREKMMIPKNFVKKERDHHEKNKYQTDKQHRKKGNYHDWNLIPSASNQGTCMDI